MFDNNSEKSNNNFTIIDNTTKIWATFRYQVFLTKSFTPPGGSQSFVPNLYARHQYISIQSDEQKNILSFYLFEVGHSEYIGVLHCYESVNGNWLSPVNAPFGGVESIQDCPAEGLLFLLNCVEDFLRNEGGVCLKIKLPPIFYRGIESEIYHQIGFTTDLENHDYYLPVISEPFENIIDPQEKRRLAKCKRESFSSENCVMTPTDLYDFIETSRLIYGYSLSISERQLTKLMNEFPEQFIVFVVKHQEEIVALSLTVLVNDEVLYNFMPADLPAYKIYSPMVMLYDCIYTYCQSNGIRFLDLGQSLDHEGNFKPSLANFKVNMGAEECAKTTIVKYF